MLICYLDDSGTDPQNSIVTLAGYIAPEDEWRKFETEVEPIFEKYDVEVLHAVDLEKTEGDFAGWTVLKKQSFVAQICRIMAPHVSLGMSMSAHKEIYKNRAAESERKRTVTPYTFCANGVLEWLMTDIRIGAAVRAQGVAFHLESGSQHNVETEQHLDSLRRLHSEVANSIKSISFVPKEQCRAIQMADLVAYYSRRHGDAMAKAAPREREKMLRDPPTMMKIITERVQHRAFVATDFGPAAPGSRFYAGSDPK